MKRLPNGFGSVSKASDAKHRYKPYKAVVTSGRVLGEDGKAKQVRKLLGYYKTRTEALDALTEYNRNPFDIVNSGMTFAQVYEAWLPTEKSPSAIHKCKVAFNHCASLHEMVFSALKVVDLESVLNSYEGNVRAGVLSLFRKLYLYALRYDIASVNYAERLAPVGVISTKTERVPFTDEEIRELWKHTDDRFCCLLLIGIYSGWRPNELVSLRIEDGVMYGGSKTDAGRNRMVPVHSKISDLCGRYGDLTKGLNVRTYQYGVNKIFEKLKMKHYPYETRHTFVTRAKRCGVDEYALKQMVGHKSSDITEHYTHRSVEDLRKEIEKVAYT